MNKKFYCLLFLLLFASCSHEANDVDERASLISQLCKVDKAARHRFLMYGCTNCAELDVIVRDFPSNHPDFENFTEYAKEPNKSLWAYDGYASDGEWVEKRADNNKYGCANELNPELGVAMGEDGFPKLSALIDASKLDNERLLSQLPSYLQKKMSEKPEIKYGEYDCIGKIVRGYKHEMEARGCVERWAQTVYITPGMVKRQLKFDASLGDDMMYEPIIEKARTACDNGHFEQWYSDTDKSKRTNTVLRLELINPEEKIYEINYNWNNGGYFPLDKVDGSGKRIGELEDSKQFGAQSLSIFCPPYNYEKPLLRTNYLNENEEKLCQDWLEYGGPRVVDAAKKTADKNGFLGDGYLRNHHFTMIGYAKFRYAKDAHFVFQYMSSDDAWLFIDGVLVADLGGTHLPAFAKIDLDYLAQNKHGCYSGDPLASRDGYHENCDLDENGWWNDGTWHHLHFFTASRQTDESTLGLSLIFPEYDLVEEYRHQPQIKEAIEIDDGNRKKIALVLDYALHEQTLKNIKNGIVLGIQGMIDSCVFPIIVQRYEKNASGSTSVQYLVYVMSSFEYETTIADGVVYRMEGDLHRVNEDGSIDLNVTSSKEGDLYSFNYPGSLRNVEEDEGLLYIKGVTDCQWISDNPIKGSDKAEVSHPIWAGFSKNQCDD